MPKPSKPLLIEILGGVCGATAIGGGTYAIIKQSELDKSLSKIKTLEQTIDSLQKQPENAEKEANKQKMEQLGQELTNEKKKVQELTQKIAEVESMLSAKDQQLRAKQKELEASQNKSNVKSEGVKKWLKEDILTTDWRKNNERQIYVVVAQGSGLSLSWNYPGFCVNENNDVYTCSYEKALTQKALWNKIK